MENEIDMKAVAKAVEDINRTWESQKAANAELAAEVKALGAARPETEAKLAKMEADLERGLKLADEAALAAKRASRVGADAGAATDLDAKALQWARTNARRHGTNIAEYSAADLAAYKSAFNRYLRKDDRALTVDETKALSVGSDPDGGYVVSPDTSGRIVTKVFETSPMRAYASVQVISTDALEGLFDLQEASSGWVNETEARPETATPDLGKWRIPVHELYAKPRATQQLLDDGEIDMEAWLAAKVAEKFARDEAAAFVTGTGIGKPRGFLTYPSGTTLPGTIERSITTADGAFAAAPNGGDVLVNAFYSLKQPYRTNAAWFMNRTTFALVRKLKDSDGAYLWQPGIQAGQPATILGAPYASFEDMPNPATDSLSIAVGDMRAAYQIVDRAGIRVLRDPFSAKPFVEFYTTKRVGGDVVNFEAIKLIEFTT